MPMREILGHLLLGSIRFRDLNQTSDSLCRQSCKDIWGHLPDGTTINELNYFVANLSQVLIKFLISSFQSFQSFFHDKNEHREVYLAVSYNFETQAWHNSYDNTIFNESLWKVDS